MLQFGFQEGDHVQICPDRGIKVVCQLGLVGNNEKLPIFYNQIGTVLAWTDRCNVIVVFCDDGHVFELNPLVLVKKEIEIGDCVAIRNEQLCRLWQPDHGEFSDKMINAVKKPSHVIHVYPDGDLRIREIDSGACWTVNPKILYYIYKIIVICTPEECDPMDNNIKILICRYNPEQPFFVKILNVIPTEEIRRLDDFMLDVVDSFLIADDIRSSVHEEFTPEEHNVITPLNFSEELDCDYQILLNRWQICRHIYKIDSSLQTCILCGFLIAKL